MPMLSTPAFGPRTALSYVTGGTLLCVWTLVWYFTRDSDLTRNQWFWLTGLFLSGVTFVLLGLLLGPLGRSARQAELPPVEAIHAEAAIQQARQSYPPAAYHAGEINALPESEPFDLVTCIDVLEHVEDDLGLLREIAGVCGRYALCVTVQGRMRPGEREIGHVRNYRRGELQEKMQAAGLTPIRTVEWGFPFYSPLFRSTVASTTGSRELL